MEAPAATFKLTTDETEIAIPLRVVKTMKTISNMFEDLGDETLSSRTDLELTQGTYQAVTLLIKYMNLWLDNTAPEEIPKGLEEPEPAKAGKFAAKQAVTLDKPWQVAFMKEHFAPNTSSNPFGTLFEAVSLANFASCRPYLDIAAQAIANEIKGQTPHQIRDKFNIINDFTPEEEAQIQRENEWVLKTGN